jgi:lipoprotein-anchoring transpeptidase ErfK/SrfK
VTITAPERHRLRRAALVAGALVAGAGVCVTVVSLVAPNRSHTSLPPPPRSALALARPTPLASDAHLARWAPVRAPATARRAPNPRAPAVARIEARTPEHTRNIVQLLGQARERSGGLWVRVRLAILPNGATAWVPRRALGGYVFVHTRLVIDRRRLRAVLFRDGRVIFRAKVGIGKRAWPTPRGQFYVRNKLTSYRSAAYGPLAFGTSARSPVLTDWPAGGYVGIHGTDQPELLPGRVSHGCIRMTNRDILRLGRLMPVGTPLIVR